MKKINQILSDNFLMLGGFVLIRLLPFVFYLLNFGVQIAPDSGTYRYGFLRWDVLSNHRGYGITIPFTLCPSDLAICILQFLSVTISGIFLIAELNKLSGKFKYLPIIAVYAVLNSPTVSIWDVWPLSHSLSLAYNITSLAFFIKYTNSRKLGNLYLCGTFLFLSSISRPNNQIAFILIVSLVIAGIYKHKNFQGWQHGNNSKAKLVIFLASLVITSFSINSHLETKWSPKLPVAILPYILDANVPISSDLIRAAKADASIPECAFPSHALNNDKGVYLTKVYSECPEGVLWLENDFKLWYIKFLISNPKSTFKQIGFGTTVGLGYPTNYGNTFPTLLPEPVLKLFIGVPKVDNGIGIYPLFGWTLLVLFLTLQLNAKRKPKTTLSSGDSAPSLNGYLFAWLLSACAGIIYQSHGDNFRVFIDNQVIITIVAVCVVSRKLEELEESKKKI